ncbi:sulfite exporter TauE/SafE family protein [Sphingobium sp. DEHP117]|uniref:sulfite exporter TauE/SafE family protein n=1 Tax=Sphingobium sp. DEHP117 TaxID=2993436 RepID=UPI0027D4F60C|nr:TSUP family transporter [Sphingobium sp. DEHP117]MDQ4420011.1 sulfite exporter TauE/SafE family protein [Sphingobium sp. DEHP117]
MDYLHPLSGFLVGTMVGLTGVGGGSLMAPIMILLLGVAPTTAVGTDLWFAALTKMVGGGVHHSQGHADWLVVRRLAYGSLPAAALVLWYLAQSGGHQAKSGFVVQALGCVLIASAIATLFQGRMAKAALSIESGRMEVYRRLLPTLTVVCGVILGTIVTLTSVGAGAIGATMLMMLYPIRLTTQKIVGTDIVHAVPLTMLAGLGYFLMGKVDLQLLGSLLIGSIPGIVIGSRLTKHVNTSFLRVALAIMLVFSGGKLLLS